MRIQVRFHGSTCLGDTCHVTCTHGAHAHTTPNLVSSSMHLARTHKTTQQKSIKPYDKMNILLYSSHVCINSYNNIFLAPRVARQRIMPRTKCRGIKLCNINTPALAKKHSSRATLLHTWIHKIITTTETQMCAIPWEINMLVHTVGSVTAFMAKIIGLYDINTTHTGMGRDVPHDIHSKDNRVHM